MHVSEYMTIMTTRAPAVLNINIKKQSSDTPCGLSFSPRWRRGSGPNAHVSKSQFNVHIIVMRIYPHNLDHNGLTF